MVTAISVAGTSVNYTTHGAGPGLVLVHGTSIDAAANFGHVIDRFTDRRRVICPNYAGCGGSTISDGELSLDLLVEQIAATIRDADSEPVDLLGDSLGAVVAAATAARYPALIRRLVLVAGWADSSDARHQLVFGTWARLQSADTDLSNRYGMSLAVSPAFLTSLGHDNIATFLRQPAPPHTARRIELGLRIDLRAQATTITMPTLVIAGTEDYLVPPYQSRALHAAIAGSRYAELATGHAVLLEKPAELVALARAFLFD